MTLDPDRVAEVVAAARGSDDELMAIVDGLMPLASQSTRSKVVFDHEELQIAIRMRGRFDRLIEQLKAIEPLKLTAAPVVVSLFSTDESDVLVSRYWAIPGEQRFAVGKDHAPTDAALGRYRDELLRLADAGWMHAYALRGWLSSRIGSRTGTIVLESWETLQPIEDKDEVVRHLTAMR